MLQVIKGISLMLTLFLLYKESQKLLNYIEKDNVKEKIKVYIKGSDFEKAFRTFLNTISFFLLILKKKPTLEEEKFIKEFKKKTKENLKESFKELLTVIFVGIVLLLFGCFIKLLAGGLR